MCQMRSSRVVLISTSGTSPSPSPSRRSPGAIRSVTPSPASCARRSKRRSAARAFLATLFARLVDAECIRAGFHPPLLLALHVVEVLVVVVDVLVVDVLFALATCVELHANA